MSGPESEYLLEMANLLRQEGIVDLESWETDSFLEIPLYSRFEQLDFMDEVSFEIRSSLLVTFAVEHLTATLERFEGNPSALRKGYRYMVSVTDWWDDGIDGPTCNYGTTGLITPNFWIGNMSAAKMSNFRLCTPTSKCSDFIAKVLRKNSCKIYESELFEFLNFCPRRVYVEPVR